MEAMTLLDHIEKPLDLTTEQMEGFIYIFGNFCDTSIKIKLLEIIKCPSSIEVRDLYGRIVFDDDGCHYHPWKSLSLEVRTIRDSLLGAWDSNREQR